jgi:hypothetical protein
MSTTAAKPLADRSLIMSGGSRAPVVAEIEDHAS